MIKRLRIKFICVIMAIVMVLLGCILAVVIYFTAQSMEMQSISMMRAIAANPFQQGYPGQTSDGIRLPYFAVQIGIRGDILNCLTDQVTSIVTALTSRSDRI